jgi:hypothetical protein
MRAYRVVLSLALSIGCGIAVQGAAFSQEYRGTMQQQMACTPDVFRLCGAQIPDVNRIVACLRQNTPRLSGRCRAVFEENVSANQAAPRGRDDQPRRYDDQFRRYDDQPRRYDDQPRRYDDQSRRYDDQPRRYDDE